LKALETIGRFLKKAQLQSNPKMGLKFLQRMKKKCLSFGKE